VTAARPSDSTDSTPAKRPLKVLHIGNIANNAYMASLILNRAGIESHLLVPDYYHIGGCPEWESAEVDGDWGNDFVPAFHRVNLHGWQRPKWVAQGPMYLAMDYLTALNQKKTLRTYLLRLLLELNRRMVTSPKHGASFTKIWYTRWTARLRRVLGIAYPRYSATAGQAAFPGAQWVKPRIGSTRLISLVEPAKRPRLTPTMISDIRAQIEDLQQRIKASDNPETTAQLQSAQAALKEKIHTPELQHEVLGFDSGLGNWQALFEHYDLIVGYSTDGIWPLAANKPFIAFEHGTIRSLPFENSFYGRQTAAVYKNADAVMITNTDVRPEAERLALKNYFFVPHPTMEDEFPDQDKKASVLRKMILDTYDAEFVIFHPARHNWVEGVRDPNWEKGNDLVIKAFHQLVTTHKVRAVLLMVEAGQMVPKSKALVSMLGLAGRVVWMKTQPNRSFVRYIKASDVIIDQFHPEPLSMGGIPPKAMLNGKPVVAYFSDEILSWAYSEMPPIINAHTVETITDVLLRLHQDPAYAKAHGEAGKVWYAKHYSNARFLEIFLQAAAIVPGVGQRKGSKRAAT
jgi:glycosyltransferase involved in cell wall biosynthesis